MDLPLWQCVYFPKIILYKHLVEHNRGASSQQHHYNLIGWQRQKTPVLNSPQESRSQRWFLKQLMIPRSTWWIVAWPLYPIAHVVMGKEAQWRGYMIMYSNPDLLIYGSPGAIEIIIFHFTTALYFKSDFTKWAGLQSLKSFQCWEICSRWRYMYRFTALTLQSPNLFTIHSDSTH